MHTTLLKRLDSPVRFLSFSMNDVLLFVIPFFIGSLLDSIFVVPVVGSALIVAGKKWTKKYPRFYVMRSLYWNLPTRSVNHLFGVCFPFSNKRFWIK